MQPLLKHIRKLLKHKPTIRWDREVAQELLILNVKRFLEKGQLEEAATRLRATALEKGRGKPLPFHPCDPHFSQFDEARSIGEASPEMVEAALQSHWQKIVELGPNDPKLKEFVAFFGNLMDQSCTVISEMNALRGIVQMDPGVAEYVQETVSNRDKKNRLGTVLREHPT